MDFAERLSLWVNTFDAIGLQAAHPAIEAIDAPAPRPARERAASAASLQEDLQRVRGALLHAIGQDPEPLAVFALPAAGRGGAPRDPAQLLRELTSPDPGYAPYQQRHAELQRQMEQMTGALREHVRESLSRHSARLRRLAALDAVMERLLARREQALLPQAASILRQRFEQLRREHRDMVADAASPDDPALWREPGGWLHRFITEWRQALVAELDLRLEPVAGLAEALAHEPNQRS